MKVSVVGLGKLGSPLSAVLADKGDTVIGVDCNAAFVNAINAGQPPVQEPGLPELIRKNASRLSATMDYVAAVAATEITFMIVPTPSDESGCFSLKYVIEAAGAIGAALKNKKEFHLVVLTSTVMPGATGSQVLPALEKASGKRCGKDFGLCYNPEFIALGSVIRDMLHPDFLLIGESDPRSGEMLAEHYKGVCNNNPPVARMNFINAELTKLAVNTFVTTKISYANMLAQVCERLPGADVDAVTSALGLDTRIGKKYLKGALGYGGPCFPRDNVAFASMARELGVHAVLAESTDVINRQQVSRLGEMALARLPRGGKAGVLGLSYKPCTNVIEESQGLQIAQYLASKGAPVAVFDPAAMENARRKLPEGVVFAASAAECMRQSSVLVIATPWDEFKTLSPDNLCATNGKPTVIDCWRLLPPEKFSAAEYVTLGRG